MAVTTYHTAVCMAVKKREASLTPAQSFGLPTAGIKQAALHNGWLNNRNSWTASATPRNRSGSSVERTGWCRKLAFMASMEIHEITKCEERDFNAAVSSEVINSDECFPLPVVRPSLYLCVKCKHACLCAGLLFHGPFYPVQEECGDGRPRPAVWGLRETGLRGSGPQRHDEGEINGLGSPCTNTLKLMPAVADRRDLFRPLHSAVFLQRLF